MKVANVKPDSVVALNLFICSVIIEVVKATLRRFWSAGGADPLSVQLHRLLTNGDI